MVAELYRVDHEQTGHHQGAEAEGPGRVVQGRAGEVAMLDDGLAAAEARLAKKREAELRAWTKEVER
jgi:hypothetical protein